MEDEEEDAVPDDGRLVLGAGDGEGGATGLAAAVTVPDFFFA